MDLQPNGTGSIPDSARSPRVDATAVVSQRLAARRRRTRRLRRRVAAAALSTFAALWTVLYVQLASGHDPALSVSVASVAAPISATTTTPAATTTTAAPTPTATTSTAQQSPAPATPAAVTTRQS